MSKKLPEKEALLNVFEVVGWNKEAADYTFDQFKKVLPAKFFKKNEGDINSLLEQMEAWANGIKNQETIEYWDGNKPNPPFKQLQDNLAEASVESLKDQQGDKLHMDIAIKNSQVLRGFSSLDGEPLSSDVVKKLDTLFNAWLADHDVITKNSTLFEKGEGSEIKVDSKGKPIKADEAKITSLLTDKKEGFEHYMEEKGFSVTVQTLPYPEQAKAATEQKVEPKQAPAEAAKEEPEGPSLS